MEKGDRDATVKTTLYRSTMSPILHIHLIDIIQANFRDKRINQISLLSYF